MIEQVLKLFPDDQIIRTSGSSSKVLPYYGGAENEDAFAHRIVYAVEIIGIDNKKSAEDGSAAMWRTLISENRLDYQTVQLVEGGTPIAVSILKRGPIAVVATSADQVEEQLLTRLHVNDADESSAQTNRIIDSILNDADAEAGGRVDVEPWKALQEWLTLGGPYEVRIPYLKAVREAYHEHARIVPLRFRRDLGSFVAAIRTSAIVHRAQRQPDMKGRIVADTHDYLVAYHALNSSIGDLYGVKVPARIRPLVEAIERFIAREDEAEVELSVRPPAHTAAIPIRSLMKEIGLSSRSLISERLNEAVALEVIKVADLGRAYGQTETRRYRVLVPSAEIANGVQRSVFPNPEVIEQKTGASAAAPKEESDAE